MLDHLERVKFRQCFMQSISVPGNLRAAFMADNIDKLFGSVTYF